MAEQWPGEIDDAVGRWRSGDEDAAREVWMLCGPRLMRLARLITGGEAAADDAVQEAFIRAWRSIGRFDPRRPFGPWMTTILVRECRRHGAKAHRQRLIPLPPPSEPGHTGLMDAVDRLPRSLRETVALHYLEGYDVAETAGLLGIPQGTVKSRLYRARRQLAELLREGDLHE